MSARAQLRRPMRGQRGQALTEFALIIPVFLFIVFGLFDVGRVVWANNALANAAREAARQAIVHGGSQSTACPWGPPGPDTVIPVASTSCAHPSPSKDAVRTRAVSAAVAGGTNVVVTVCYGTGCSGNTDTLGATNVRGTPVTVRVTSDIQLITGTFLGLRPFTASGSSTMLVNH